MNNNNPQVFPHPASQIDGITLFDMIMLSLLNSRNWNLGKDNSSNFKSILDATKEMLHLRDLAIQNLDNHKSMNQIMKEIEDNEKD